MKTHENSSLGRRAATAGLAGAIGLTGVALAADSAAATTQALASPASPQRATGGWQWYGYRLSRSETNAIANVSLWDAVRGVSSSAYIPYSAWIMRIYAVNWVLTARNARSMGQCLAISYGGTGLIVGC